MLPGHLVAVVLQTRFWWMRPPSLSCSMWKRTSFWEVAEKSFTGTLTNPKLMDPVQIGLRHLHHLGSGALRRGPLQRRLGCVFRRFGGIDAEVAEEALLVLAQAAQL